MTVFILFSMIGNQAMARDKSGAMAIGDYYNIIYYYIRIPWRVSASHGRRVVGFGSGGTAMAIFRFCLSTTRAQCRQPVFGITSAHGWECGEGSVRWFRHEGALALPLSIAVFRCDARSHCVLTSPNARRLYAIHRLSPYLILSFRFPLGKSHVLYAFSTLFNCQNVFSIDTFLRFATVIVYTVCKYTFTFLFYRRRVLFSPNASFSVGRRTPGGRWWLFDVHIMDGHRTTARTLASPPADGRGYRFVTLAVSSPALKG